MREITFTQTLRLYPYEELNAHAQAYARMQYVNFSVIELPSM